LINFLENLKSNTNNNSSSINDTSILHSSSSSSSCSEISRLSTISTTSTTTTITNPLDENCFIIYRKKDDDHELPINNRINNNHNNKQKRTKSNQLNKTISYTLNELTLFNKLDIKEPKNILQIDDVLVQLNYKKDEYKAKIESLELELKEFEDYFNSKNELNDLINNIMDCDDDLNQDLIRSSIETLETIQQASDFIDLLDKNKRQSTCLIYSDTNSEISNFDYPCQSSSITSSICDINNNNNKNTNNNEDIDNDDNDDDDNKLLSNSQKTSSDDGSDTTTILIDNNEKCNSSSGSGSSKCSNKDLLLNDKESLSLSRKSSFIKNNAVLGLKNTLNVAQAKLNRYNSQQEQFSDGYGSPGSQLSASSNDNNVYFQQQQ
jgi:hypothetical protein